MSKIPLSENSVVHGLPRLPWRLARLPRKKNNKKKMNPQLFDSQAEGNHFHTRVPLATLFFGLLELKISWTSTTTTTTILNLQNQSIFAETIFISRNLIPGRFVKNSRSTEYTTDLLNRFREIDFLAFDDKFRVSWCSQQSLREAITVE